MTRIPSVRFRLVPTVPEGEAALPGLLEPTQDISSVVQALPPDAAFVKVRGARRFCRASSWRVHEKIYSPIASTLNYSPVTSWVGTAVL
jgi:hypothetical protein